jgi:molybdopterin synthase sulfur carrier subunit
MRIQVKGYLNLREAIGQQPFEEVAEGTTVRALVQQLALELGDDFSQMFAHLTTGAKQPSIALLVNGRHCSHLPAGLDTELQDGDEVAVFPPVMGG